MFIPIGGIFIFGNNDSKAGSISNLIIGIINLTIGALTLFFAFANERPFMKFFGFVITGLGLLMVIFALIGLLRQRGKKKVE